MNKSRIIKELQKIRVNDLDKVIKNCGKGKDWDKLVEIKDKLGLLILELKK